MSVKVVENDKEASLNEIKDQISTLTSEKETLQQRLSEYEAQTQEYSGRASDALKAEIARLEQQIESINQENIRDLSQLNNKNEESLQQLKSFYE